ncbi:WcbI family polysaccharide biosynthesis putative acetyltransferase [Gordonia terrae]|uniref:WcbI family polysaccharide biosynthesis putative acetyltransferase n=1 Tax=Gordonia terrae TaxID=2055 RepID=UPI00200B69AE|nr:WcbI family polysaccharide biosynthesis putative acetyltransferase [Gordonia terrae]UPW07283.1 WcbI family polysaccharide biosynthesis putative acetyltransferase [Gordonia terrae]
MTPHDDVPVDGRTRHYGDFYGVTETPLADDRQLLLVWGNCQAEALRIVLSSSPDLRFRTVRVPPVHELESSDVDHVERLVRRAAVIVSQPVRAGYRGLPIGGPDLVDLAPSARVIVWPVIRYGGLYPFQVIARHPAQPSAVPAAVPYHDLRTVLAARDGRRSFAEWDVDVTGEHLREAARWSVEQLAARERRQCDIAISDILLDAGADAAHTINHPGNRVLLTLGRRILDALGASAPIPPTRELLGNIRAPLEQRVIEALGIDASARIAWDVDGAVMTEEVVHRSQMQWYADHPEYIDAVLDRYVELIDILGLA